jgi:hypothetical protein
MEADRLFQDDQERQARSSRQKLHVVESASDQGAKRGGLWAAIIWLVFGMRGHSAPRSRANWPKPVTTQSE